MSKFKCIECDFEDADEEGDICNNCLESYLDEEGEYE